MALAQVGNCPRGRLLRRHSVKTGLRKALLLITPANAYLLVFMIVP